MVFFGALGLFGLTVAVGMSLPLAITYARTGLVPRLPTAILATGISIASVLCLFAGLILDTVVRGRREMRRLAYLQYFCAGSGEDPAALQGESHERRYNTGRD